jgi:hypothetical protein
LNHRPPALTRALETRLPRPRMHTRPTRRTLYQTELPPLRASARNRTGIPNVPAGGTLPLSYGRHAEGYVSKLGFRQCRYGYQPTSYRTLQPRIRTPISGFGPAHVSVHACLESPSLPASGCRPPRALVPEPTCQRDYRAAAQEPNRPRICIHDDLSVASSSIVTRRCSCDRGRNRTYRAQHCQASIPPLSPPKRGAIRVSVTPSSGAPP